MTDALETAGRPTDVPLFRAFDRGILVSSLYAATLIVAAEARPLDGEDAGVHMTVWALCGFIAGAIGGFSNTLAHESARRDLARNSLDGLMISIWTINIILLINALWYLDLPSYLAQYAGLLVAGTLVGALIGEPLLMFCGRLTIRGVRPFDTANQLAESIEDENTRFAARVILHTIVVIVLAAILFAILIAIAIAIAIALAIGALYVAFQVWRSQSSSGLRLERGLRVDKEGRVRKKGFLFDTPTGTRIKRDASGNQHVVKEGIFFDSDTGLYVDDKGRTKRSGLLFDSEVEGIDIRSDGVSERK
jgi:hypothetical protein